ncbi:hypothetical protein BS50DRAFT_610419 [Corynespora cassiicola Philippines]|uniref:NAD(P)-binding protein n=1 Tax=Corynespora cassiicola Philippines TaxID=1448308 RepID=A0A2T2NP31_CORCC|nr:hypothetical protein BS50DRAFT_610419 [Corynespora cassiicola Philippines]
MTRLRWLATGCSSGIGESFVRSIITRGDKTASLDVTAPLSDIKAVVAKALEDGPIDVLVNYAGYVEAGIAEEASKFALEGWYDCLRQEIARLGIKSIIFELGFFSKKIINPDNVKLHSDAIEDYKPGTNGNQPGDPKEQGVAQGKPLPERLPLGPDCLATLRKKFMQNLAICSEWEEVI